MASWHPPTPSSDHEALFEIYGAVREIQTEQARVAKELKEKLDTICDRCEAEDQRVSLLEKWRAAITGGLTVVGIIAGVALGHVLRLWLP